MNRIVFVFFFQAEDGIRDLVRSRGLGDVYKRQAMSRPMVNHRGSEFKEILINVTEGIKQVYHTKHPVSYTHLTLPTIYSV